MVTSEVSFWFQDHSTKNPLGVVPDRKFTRVLEGSKFDGSVYLADGCRMSNLVILGIRFERYLYQRDVCVGEMSALERCMY